MIGNHHRGYKIIAALPINGGEMGHMIVTAMKIRQPGEGHRSQFVTWFTDSQGVFGSPIHFTAHDLTAGTLRTMAIGNMISRAGHITSAFAR
jgi:hypothetical protein